MDGNRMFHKDRGYIAHISKVCESCHFLELIFTVFRLLDNSLFSFITHQPTSRLVDFQNTKPPINPQTINY